MKKDLWHKIMREFKPPSGFELEDYYTFSLMQRKKDRMWSICLLYDYTKNSCKSNSIAVKDLEEAFEICRILQMYAIDKSEKPREFSLLNNEEENPF